MKVAAIRLQAWGPLVGLLVTLVILVTALALPAGVDAIVVVLAALTPLMVKYVVMAIAYMRVGARARPEPLFRKYLYVIAATVCLDIAALVSCALLGGNGLSALALLSIYAAISLVVTPSLGWLVVRRWVGERPSSRSASDSRDTLF